MKKIIEFNEDIFVKEYEKAIELNSSSILMLGSTVEKFNELVSSYTTTAETLYNMHFIGREVLDNCQKIYKEKVKEIEESIVIEEPKKVITRRRVSKPVEEISKEEIEELIRMGFEIKGDYDSKNASLYHGEYDIELHIYHSHKDSEYQGIIFDITREKESLYQSTGKNMVVKIRKWIENKKVIK